MSKLAFWLLIGPVLYIYFVEIKPLRKSKTTGVEPPPKPHDRSTTE